MASLYAVIYRLPKKGIVGDIYESEAKAKVMAETIADSWGCTVKVVSLPIPEGI